jgi:citrate lyase subunit beta / citryl-CoA lyase
MAGARWDLRSLLFVPGHQPRMISKARSAEADAVILDLEDGVGPEEKPAARRTIAGALDEGFPESLVVFLRVNSLHSGLLDLDLREAFRPRVDGVCLPKCRAGADTHALDARLRLAEDLLGLVRGRVRLLPMLESPQGVAAALEIARECPRVCAVAFGAEDFAAELGVARTREGVEVASARAAVGLAVRAAGLDPIDGIYADFGDDAGLRADCLQARRMGYAGKMVIHPGQIAAVHEVFAPTTDEVERARRIAGAFEEARARGSGLTVVDGAMVDLPVALQAQRILERARRSAT